MLQVTSRWPAELESKQRRLAAVQDTLNNGINTEVRRHYAQQYTPLNLAAPEAPKALQRAT